MWKLPLHRVKLYPIVQINVNPCSAVILTVDTLTNSFPSRFSLNVSLGPSSLNILSRLSGRSYLLVIGVVIANDCTIDVEPEKAIPTGVMDILRPYESEGGSYFFRLQCLSDWEVMERARWQLTQ